MTTPLLLAFEIRKQRSLVSLVLSAGTSPKTALAVVAASRPASGIGGTESRKDVGALVLGTLAVLGPTHYREAGESML